MPVPFDYRHCRVMSRLDGDGSRQLVDSVFAEELPAEQIFRDNWRTLSARVNFEGQSLLLKIPRARNSRKWEQFLTRFRDSDALRTFRHLEQMSAMGFSAPDPVLACECREGGVVIDSFVCYAFVEGRAAEPADAPKILAALRALHQRGYLRSDAQLPNFLMVGETVTFIDFRLKRPRFLPRLQKARELDRFLRSCPEARGLLSQAETSSGWLWLASRLENTSFWRRNLKRRLRGRHGSGRGNTQK